MNDFYGMIIIARQRAAELSDDAEQGKRIEAARETHSAWQRTGATSSIPQNSHRPGDRIRHALRTFFTSAVHGRHSPVEPAGSTRDTGADDVVPTESEPPGCTEPGPADARCVTEPASSDRSYVGV